MDAGSFGLKASAGGRGTFTPLIFVVCLLCFRPCAEPKTQGGEEAWFVVE